MAQESQNLLLHPLPTNSRAPQFGFLTTVEQLRQFLHNTMNTISYHSPGALLLTGNGQLRANLYMKLGLVFTTYIPLHLSIANNVFFCPVTMLLKILLEFFTFGLIFYCPQKFSAIIIHSPFQSVMNILNNAFSCLSHEIVHSFHRLFIPPLHTS